MGHSAAPISAIISHAMRTNQAIYFVFFLAGAVLYLAFGIYPLLVIVALFFALLAWSNFKHPHEWRAPDHTVRVVKAREPWVEYQEADRILAVRAEWTGTGKNLELLISFENEVYFPPDYRTALSAERIAQIQQRISEALTKLKIRGQFVRQGWTSVR